MAMTIAETPILTNEDAKRFENAIKNVEALSKDEIEKIRTSYNLLKGCDRD